VKIINLLPNAQPYDLPRQQAEAMIAAGMAKAYVAPVVTRVPKAKWGLERRQIDGRPYISVKCESCNTARQTAASAATKSFQHCGINEPVPSHIAAEYERVFGKWKPRPEPKEATPMAGFVIPI
jgi:hypothetical protein